MYAVKELVQRRIIIQNAGLDDAIILDENYTHMIKETPNPDERDQLLKLRLVVKDRIKKLKGHNKNNAEYI